jgi:hypothetical protein
MFKIVSGLVYGALMGEWVVHVPLFGTYTTDKD